MRLMPTLSVGLIAVVVQIGMPLEACAQALAQEGPPRRLAVVQFGMPADAKFVFCEGQDCPARSLKHFAVATPVVRTPAAPIVAPTAVRTMEPAGLAQAREEIYVPPKTAPAKKPKRRPVKGAIDCRSVPATK